LFLERDLIFWVFFRSTALVRIASDPTDKEWASSVLKTTEDIVVIKDKYAKARFHVLVVPRRVAVDTVGDVTVEHLPLLKEMYQTAKEMIQARLAEEPKATFRVGFHSSPSMQYARIIGNVFPAERLQQPTFTHRDFFTIFRRLHMHVISTDFDSPALKQPKHWLSFTTDFFVDAAPFIQAIESTGKVPHIDSSPEGEDALEREIPYCAFCRKTFGKGAKGLQQLKVHHLKDHLDKGEKLEYPL
jgi:aprataxin